MGSSEKGGRIFTLKNLIKACISRTVQRLLLAGLLAGLTIFSYAQENTGSENSASAPESSMSESSGSDNANDASVDSSYAAAALSGSSSVSDSYGSLSAAYNTATPFETAESSLLMTASFYETFDAVEGDGSGTYDTAEGDVSGTFDSAEGDSLSACGSAEISTPFSASAGDTDDASDSDIVISPATASLTDSSSASSTDELSLYDKIETMLKDALSGIENNADTAQAVYYCCISYDVMSEAFDMADDAYFSGSIDSDEYDRIIRLIYDYYYKYEAWYDQCGYDPYSTDLQDDYFSYYSEAGCSTSGTDLIISGTLYWTGYSSTQVSTNIRYGLGTYGSPTSGSFSQYFSFYYYSYYPYEVRNISSTIGSVSFGGVSFGPKNTIGTGLDSTYYQVDFTWTIPFGSVSTFNDSYNSTGGSWLGYFQTYIDDSEMYQYHGGPAASNYSSAYSSLFCQHTSTYWSCTGSTHTQICSNCGETVSSGSHDSNTSDTTSNPGYTVRKCSVCGYVMSTTANSYKVTLDNQSATSAGTGSVTATYAASMPAITVPSRTGYIFKGYYSGKNGSGTLYYNANGSSARTWNISSNTTLYAYWTAITYSISFDANTGSSKVTATMSNTSAFSGMSYGSSYSLSSLSVSREGYTLKGWNTAANGSGTSYAANAAVSNLTTTQGAVIKLYAIWALAYDTNVSALVSNSFGIAGTS